MRILRGLVIAGCVIGCSALAFAQKSLESVQPVDVYLRTARIALQTNPPEFNRAIQNLDIARANYPENHDVHFLMGTIWAEKDEIDSMVASYELSKSLATPKQWEKEAKELDKLYESLWIKRLEDAVKLFNQADSLASLADTITDPALADSTRKNAGIVRGMSQNKLRQCVLLRPLEFRAYSVRGLIHQRRGDVDSTIADLTKAETLFHRYEFVDSTTDWYDSTVFFSGSTGSPTEAYKEFEKKYKKLTDEKRSRYRNILSALGSAYYDQEQWGNTIAIYRRYHQLDPANINTIVTIADCFSRLDNEQEAYKWYELVVRQDPNSKDTWYNMGIFFYNNAIRLQDSLAKYDKTLLANAGDNVAKTSYIGFLRQSFENFARGIPNLRKVVELDKKDDETWRLLGIAYYSIASQLTEVETRFTQADRDAILTDIRTLIENHVGVAPEQSALWEESREMLLAAAENNPDNIGICRMMKVTLARLNRPDELQEWAPKCP